MNRNKLLCLIFILIFFTTALTQVKESPDLRIAVKGNEVFIYQPKLLPTGYGFNIYRKYSGEKNYLRLNNSPVTQSDLPDDMVNILGDKYDDISEKLKTNSPEELYLKLKTNRVLGLLYTYAYPEVAKSLGRLFIDSTAKIGKEATYKVVYVNINGTSIGDSLIKTEILNPLKIISPSHLTAENKGNQITLSWDYPKAPEKSDDMILSFNLYRKLSNKNLAEKINNKIILRDADKTHFSFSFDVSTLGETVNYFVTAQAITGEESRPSKSISYFIKDNVPPQPVTGLKAVYENKGVTLAWQVSPSPDTKGYNVFRSQSIKRDYKKISKRMINPFTIFYRDSSVAQGDVYYYKVDVTDSSGNTSEKSTAAIIRVPVYTAPKTPEKFKAVLNKYGKIYLSWLYPYKKSRDFKSFILLRRNADSWKQPYGIINKDSLFTNFFTDNGINSKGFRQGYTYDYALYAQDKSDNKSDTLFASVKIPDTTPPQPPVSLRVKNVDGIRAEIYWSASPSTDVVKYNLYKSQTADGFKIINSFPANIKNFRDEKVVKGKKYFYSISAVDSSGNEGKKSSIDTVLIRDFDPPSRVRNVRADFINSQVKINWEPVYDADLAGYNVYRSSIATGNYKLIAGNLKAVNFVDQNGTMKNWYIIKSFDTSGNESKGSVPVKPWNENVSAK